MKSHLHHRAQRSCPRRASRFTRQPSPKLLVRALAACSVLTFWPGAAEVRAQALPSGMATVAGQATARTVGGTLTVTNSPSAIINWSSFSIGASNAVRFDQASATSQVLNRVVGNDPSAILGSLSSNGRVWLLNPNGVLFGHGARIDVAGIVSSTLNLNNADWLAGNHRFLQGAGSPAGIVNQGELRSSLGGQIALIGATVRNEGSIDAPGGQVVLAAGTSIDLVDSMTPNVSVKLNAVAGEVVNLGSLKAAGGRIDIHAGTVNQSGIVRADSLATGPGGEIVLQATDRLTLAGAGETSAVASAGQGGTIKLLGREVGLLDTARVDASGAVGGGEVLVGGGQQGKDPAVPNAQAVYFGPTAGIAADAAASGHGGRIILWSDKATRAFGGLSVRGGPLGGDGGFIETSGGWLDARPALVDTAAPKGRSGTWLLDPYDLTISNAGSNTGFNASFTANASPALITSATLSAALNTGTQVVVSTGTGDQAVGPGTGNITVSSANILTTPVQSGGSLTLIADGYISLSNSIIQASGSFGLPVTLRAGRGGEGKGSIFFNNSSIVSNGGNIDLGGYATYAMPNGGTLTNAASTLVENRYSIFLGGSSMASSGATLEAGAGTIAVRGGNIFSGSDLSAAAVQLNGALLTGRFIDIQGSAAGDPLYPPSGTGVRIAGGRLVATEGIAVSGFGGNRGIDVSGNARFTVSPVASTSAAAILLQGTGQAGIGTAIEGSTLTGTLFSVLPSSLAVTTNGIAIEGTAQSPGNSGAYGVSISGDGNFGSSSLLVDLSQSNDILTITAPASAVDLGGSLIKAGRLGMVVDSGASTDIYNVDISTGGAVHVRSAGLLSLASVAIRSNSIDTPTPVYLSVGDGSLVDDKSIFISGTTIKTNGGEIFAGGPVFFGSTPEISNSYGTASGRNAVFVRDSILDAGAGQVFLHGHSISGGGTGVTVSNTLLSGQEVIVDGEASGAGFDGVRIQSGSVLTSPYFVVAVGKAPQFGVVVNGGSTLEVTPFSYDPGALLRIVGESTGSQYGSYVYRRGGSGPSTLKVTNGAVLELSGINAGGGPSLGIAGTAGDPFPVIDGTTGGAINLVANRDPINFNTFANTGIARIDDAVITGSLDGVLVKAPTNLLISNSTLDVAGGIELHTQNLETLPGTRLISNSDGTDAISLYGPTSNYMTTWANSADPLTVLQTPKSRWLAFLTDVNVTADYPTNLPYDFKRYNGGLTGEEVGNGLVFAEPQTATVGINLPIAKYYDGTTAIAVNPAATNVTTSVTGDVGQVEASASFDFASKNAGTGQSILVTAGSGQPALVMTDALGKPVYGYTLASNLTGTIVPKQLDLSGSRAYDGTLAVDGSALVLGGLVGSETLTLGGAGTVASKNVGTGKTLSLGTLALGNGLNGGLAGNYSFTGGESSPLRTVDITAAALTLSTLDVTKTYDGVLLASGSATTTAGTLFSGDTLSGGSFEYTDKNVGSGNKTVTVSGVTVNDGNGGANYTVSYADNTTSTINPASLVVGTSDVTKVYDGGIAALGTAALTSGTLFGSDSLSGGSFAYTDKNVGLGNKTVTVSGITVNDGNSGANYTVSYTNNTTSSITAASLVLAVGVDTKIYDGGVIASGTATVTSGQLFGSDSVSPTFAFADKNVGSGKPVTVSGLTVKDGNDGANYNVSYSADPTGNITPASLTLGTTNVTKVYDGALAALGTVAVASGTLFGSDSLSGGSFEYTDKNVGIGNKTVTTSGVTVNDGNGGANYSISYAANTTSSITPASLTLGTTSVTKVYDGELAAFGTATVTSGTLFGSDSLSGGSLVYTDKNVGSGNKTVTLSGAIVNDGNSGANYAISFVANTTSSITPASLTLGTTNVTKVYDGGLAALGTAAVTSGTLFGGDSLSGGSFAYTDKNVGSGDKTVTASGVTVNDGNGGANYNVRYVSNTTSSITPLAVSVNGVTVRDKVYDAGTVATLSGTGSISALGNDVVALSGSALASYADKNVGIAKSVLVSGLSLVGADAANYQIASTQASTASITPAQLTLSGLTAVGKVYDATRTASLNGTAVVTALGSDSVSVSGTPLALFADKNVGTGKIVTLSSGFTLTGTDAGNYTVAPLGSLTANITPYALTVSGLTATSKVYDATRTATLAGTGSISPLGSDSVSVAGTPQGQFADKNVGTAKAVTLVGALTLSGADAANYTLVRPASLVADITPATLQVTGVTANGKVYDATSAATLGGTATVAALPTDSVTVGGTPVANFSTRNVGRDINVAVGGYTLGGVDAGNYSLVQPIGLSADITPATLRYLATPVAQSAGIALPPLTGTVDGFVGGESLATATTGSLAFTTPASTTSAPGSYAVFGSGLAAANYSFVQDPANATALTLNVRPPDQILAKPLAENAPKKALEFIARPPPLADPGMGGVVDLVPTPGPSLTRTARQDTSPRDTQLAVTQAIEALETNPLAAPATGELSARRSASRLFETVDLSALSDEALTGMLDARALYKQQLFADAVEALEKDPTLADLPACKTREDLLAGGCVLTEELKNQLKAGTRVATGVATAARVGADTARPAAAGPAAVATPDAAPAPASPVPPAATFVAVAPPPGLLGGSARRVLTASLPQITRKVALVVGVDRYDDPTIPALANAVGDARAIAKVLESQTGYETVVLENATKKSVVNALNQLALELGPNDSVIFYYAGHGELVESTKLGYWQLADSDAKRPQTWLSNADIGKMMSQVEASQVALVSDSCYSGSLVADQRIRAAIGTVDPAQMLSRRSVVVMSSGGNEPVADAGKQGHSPFAWNLMNNLRQLSAWQPGGNVFERVRFAVAKELPQRPQYGAFTAAGHQGGGDYLFEQRQLEPGTR